MPAIDEFRANIQVVRDLYGLGQAIAAQTTLDPSEIYRAALAMSISALDRYIHEKTAQEMMRVHRGQRPPTPAFDRFQISLAAARSGLADPAIDLWLDKEIRSLLGLRAFQKAEPIADAVRLFCPVELWNQVAARVGLSAQDIRTRLDVLADRRNKIVHEFDSDPSTPGARWGIGLAMVQDAAAFVLAIGEAIESVT